MNKRNLLLSLGLGALAITLIALPGHSARLQNPYKSASEQLQAKMCALETHLQQVSEKLTEQGEEWENLQEVEKLQGPEENSFEVFFGGGGSWLGIETNEVTAAKVKELKLPAERGVLVGKIIADSPASKAGLKENDVITEVNGQRVEGTAQFRRMIREIPAGRSVQLTLVRDGRPQGVSITLGKMESRHTDRMMMHAPAAGSFAFRIPEVAEMPEIAELGELNALDIPGLLQPRLGIDAEDLQGDLGTYFGAPEGEGVLVRNVFPDSPAARAGIRAGDVITNVDGKRIRHIQELRELLKGATGAKSLKVGLVRNKNEMILDVAIPTKPKKEIHQHGERSNL